MAYHVWTLSYIFLDIVYFYLEGRKPFNIPALSQSSDLVVIVLTLMTPTPTTYNIGTMEVKLFFA